MPVSHGVQKQTARVCVSRLARAHRKGRDTTSRPAGPAPAVGPGPTAAISLQSTGSLSQTGVAEDASGTGPSADAGRISSVADLAGRHRQYALERLAVSVPQRREQACPMDRLSGLKPRFLPAESDDAGLWHNLDKGKMPAGPAQDRGGQQETQNRNVSGSDDMAQTPIGKMGGRHAD